MHTNLIVKKENEFKQYKGIAIYSANISNTIKMFGAEIEGRVYTSNSWDNLKKRIATIQKNNQTN